MCGNIDRYQHAGTQQSRKDRSDKPRHECTLEAFHAARFIKDALEVKQHGCQREHCDQSVSGQNGCDHGKDIYQHALSFIDACNTQCQHRQDHRTVDHGCIGQVGDRKPGICICDAEHGS